MRVPQGASRSGINRPGATMIACGRFRMSAVRTKHLVRNWKVRLLAHFDPQLRAQALLQNKAEAAPPTGRTTLRLSWCEHRHCAQTRSGCFAFPPDTTLRAAHDGRHRAGCSTYRILCIHDAACGIQGAPHKHKRATHDVTPVTTQYAPCKTEDAGCGP